MIDEPTGEEIWQTIDASTTFLEETRYDWDLAIQPGKAPPGVAT